CARLRASPANRGAEIHRLDRRRIPPDRGGTDGGGCAVHPLGGRSLWIEPALQILAQPGGGGGSGGGGGGRAAKLRPPDDRDDLSRLLLPEIHEAAAPGTDAARL